MEYPQVETSLHQLGRILDARMLSNIKDTMDTLNNITYKRA
jgi:hypothetical protein